MELTNTSFLLLMTGVFLIWLWLRRQYSYWSGKGVYTVPFSYFWGNMKELLLQQLSFGDKTLSFYQILKAEGVQHGGVYLTFMPVYMPVDISLIKAILQVDFAHFVDRGLYSNEKADPLSAHLFSMEGKKWRLLRNKLTPTFTSGKMKMMYETLIECTTELYRVMDTELGNAIDIKDILGRFTTDTIGSCAFGLECNSLENPHNEFRERGKELFHRNFFENIRQFFIFALPGLMKRINAKVISTETSEFFMRVVKDTVTYRERNNVSRKDFMQLLIQLKNSGRLVDDERQELEHLTEDENKITIEEIAAQAFIFFEAGFETSSTTMTFCLYELAKNKNIQDKVRLEIQTILAKYDGRLTYDAAMNLHYMEQTINETLRKYPPVPTLNRVCTKDYKVPGTDVVLEKGVKLMIPVIGVHRDPEFYPEPDKFEPERFTEENKKTRPPFTFLPFGEGPRVCIGIRFGMMQTKVGLAALLLNYEFSVNNRTEEPLKYEPQSFIMSTKGGVWLDFKKISSTAVQLLPQKLSKH